MKYAAFLRGINIGNKQVKMEQLREVLTKMGFENIKTVLASGNIVFETSETDILQLTKNVEEKLATEFGFQISIILMSSVKLKNLVDTHPFASVKQDANTKLYVTFLKQSTKPSLKTPFHSPTKDFEIFDINQNAIFSVVHLSQTTGTLDLMDFLEKKFGEDLTTRNWNTIEKMLKL